MHAVIPTVGVTGTANPQLVLQCTTTGAPAAITWRYSGTSRVYTNDGDHQIVRSLLNRVTSMFESRLIFVRHPYLSDSGERVCTATSTYISTNSSETITSTAVGKFVIAVLEVNVMIILLVLLGESHFGLYSVGEAVSINCVDTSGSVNLVQWLNSTGAVLTFGSRSVTLTISPITDRHHGMIFICQIHSSGASRDLNYTFIILSKFIYEVF